MNVVVLIENREAIPVRAIPFVTGWTMSPDAVASSLAMTDLITRLRGVSAFYWSEGVVAPLLPKEWDGIEADLEALSNRLQAEEEIDRENYPKWRRDSIPLLPESCFVWRDEFEAAFRHAYSPERFSFLDEREGERELNFRPRIPPEQAPVVMEGFESPSSYVRKQWPWGDYETPLLRILAGAVEKWCMVDEEYPSKKSGLVQDWIAQEMRKAGLPVSKALIDHLETIIAPRAYSHTRQRVNLKQ